MCVFFKDEPKDWIHMTLIWSWVHNWSKHGLYWTTNFQTTTWLDTNIKNGPDTMTLRRRAPASASQLFSWMACGLQSYAVWFRWKTITYCLSFTQQLPFEFVIALKFSMYLHALIAHQREKWGHYICTLLCFLLSDGERKVVFTGYCIFALLATW